MNLINQQAVDAATGPALDRGIRVFADLFAQDESAHVDAMLAFLDPPESAMVIDMGCGVGEVAKLMKERRPDLEILLVNTSEVQLAHAPIDFGRLVCDFHETPLPDAVADVLIYSYSLCQSGDWTRALAEAHRLLKPGGLLFIADMARLSGDNVEFEQLLGAHANTPEWIEWMARNAGFKLDEAAAPPVVVSRMRELLADDVLADRLLDGVVPTMWVFTALEGLARTLNAHEGHIAFQFSGGRDSTAALYLMREHWPLMTVYHVDTGDQFPETREVVDKVEAEFEAATGRKFERIETDVHAIRIEHGLPSDLTPTDNTGFGMRVSGRTLQIQDRYSCCTRSLMNPMHDRMYEDNMTLLIRGQRDDEYAKPPLRSGDTSDGFEVLYPIQEWSAAQVDAYLASMSLPVAPFYAAGMRRAPECMGCTAWLDEGRAAYMRERHPEKHAIFITNMATIRAEIDRSLGWLNHETEA